MNAFESLRRQVPQLLATPGVARAQLLKTPVYEEFKLKPVPLWHALWGDAPPTSDAGQSTSGSGESTAAQSH